ncbi:hypothetical protein E1B28_000503 [Marasmius oreades]|uniref:Enoyl reductase (ER) domain-containing protein n=1 Tax=Marasmius oreades TaxID=181124 RepID=A0A9P7V1L2_9AGAR|nr:uncharacterized protein E1B28_000503 [Marasmius oreades]KAG7098570.1 hypothetical protein E1B28_000503 [Marasmius oreades]
MRAVVVKELAHHTKIPITKDAPEPQTSENQLLVDVYSTGLNFFDILQAQGKHQSRPQLPFVLGTEFAGRISRNSPIPKGCKFNRGDRVFGAGQGAFADKVAVYPEQLLPLPDILTYDEGAGLYVTWPTSYEGLVGRANMKPGEWVLVTAAAGGVGIVAVQLAKLLGGKVIAAAGSNEKMEVAKRFGGADFVVDYTKPGWQKEVSKITGGKGVDVVYDPVGLIQDTFKCIAWKGRAVVVGFAGGDIEKVPTNLILLKNISVVGLHWGAYRIHEPGQMDTVWHDILELLKSGYPMPCRH